MTQPTPTILRRVLVTGAAGFLGKAVVAQLQALGDVSCWTPSSKDFNLTSADAVDRCFRWARPEIVVHLACPYGGGGIGYANAHPAELASGMVLMDSLLIRAAPQFNVRMFLGVGSVCAYPERFLQPLPHGLYGCAKCGESFADYRGHLCQPIGEDQLWNGHPEPVNAPYGLAKRMQLTLLQAARKEWGLNGVHLILANLYGPGDRFGTGLVGHVIPSTIVKVYEAMKAAAPYITAWGDGSPTREFCYIEDAARAVAMAVEYEGRGLNPGEPVNIVSGEEVEIRTVVRLIATLLGYEGEIRWDPSKPNGQQRRWFSNSRARTTLNWAPRIGFQAGLARTVEWWLEQQKGVAQ